MSPAPSIGGVPAGTAVTSSAPIDGIEGVLGDDAVAFAPDVAPDDAVVDPDPLRQEPVVAVVPGDARTQLEKVVLGELKHERIDAIFRAARQFNATVGDGRSVDELTLGLLWLSEGGARLGATLDPSDTERDFALLIQILINLWTKPSEMRRVWRITTIGGWSFGLDDLVNIDPLTLDAFSVSAAQARWKRLLAEHADWTHAVPFASANGATQPSVVTTLATVEVSFTAAEAVGFLVAVAARFTKQLWALPGELATRGITLSTDRVDQIPIVEPVLAYMCFFQRAPKAAAIWEALMFLIDLSSAVVLAAPFSSDPGAHYDLLFVIDVLNQWLDRLRDTSELSVTSILHSLVKDETAKSADGRLARSVLADVVARSDWTRIPSQPDLDEEGRTLLHQLVDSWSVFARRLGELHAQDRLPLPPGELFFQGADGSLGPALFAGYFGSLGFGARNYGERFQKATQLPLGAACRRVTAPAAPAQ